MEKISPEELNVNKTSTKIENQAREMSLDEDDARKQKEKEDSYFEKLGNKEKGQFKNYSEYLSNKNKKDEEKNKEAVNKLIDGILEYDEKNTRGKKIESENNLNNNMENKKTTTTKESVPQQDQINNNDTEKVSPFIETENRSFFGRMSSGAKEMMSKAYEGIYMTPGVNNLVGKMEIAYNQFWIDKKETKANKLKSKMDAISSKKNSLDEAERQIKETSKMMQGSGFSNPSSLLSKTKKIEEMNFKLSNKENKLQERIEKRENRVRLYTNKRDAIADRLINHYDKKLSPIEGKIEALEDRRNKVELFCVATEVRLDEQKAKIKRLEESKLIIEKHYIDAGLTEKKIKHDKFIKELESQINQGYTDIQIEKSKIETKRKEINEKIARVDKKAEPYRNKRDQFVRVKDRRPVDFGLKERKYSDEFKSQEKIKSHTRDYGKDKYDGVEEVGNDQNNEQERKYSDDYEKMEKLSDLTDRLNIHIKKGRLDKKFIIDKIEFSGATRLSESTKMSLDNFKKIIGLFYKTKNIQGPELEKIINKFN